MDAGTATVISALIGACATVAVAIIATRTNTRSQSLTTDSEVPGKRRPGLLWRFIRGTILFLMYGFVAIGVITYFVQPPDSFIEGAKILASLVVCFIIAVVVHALFLSD
jgi:hypothetical protein